MKRGELRYGNAPPFGQKKRSAAVRYWTSGLLISVVLLTSLSACATRPEPCNCQFAEEELTRYTNKYLDALEDVGNLRQQNKACQEKK